MQSKYVKIAVNILTYLFIILLICLLVPRLLTFFMPFVIGWIIAMIANPLVRFLERRLKIVRRHSSFVIIVGVLGLISVGGYFAVAKILEEGAAFLGSLPKMYGQLVVDFQSIGENLSGFAQKLPPETRLAITEFFSNFEDYVSGIISKLGMPTVAAAGNMAKNIPNLIIYFFFTVLSAYFFIADRDKIMLAIKKAAPEEMKKYLRFLKDSFFRAVGGYFKAQFKIMGVVAVILFVGFLILDVNYAVLWALLIAVLDFLPFLGTGTVLIPWALLKVLTKNYHMAVGLAIIYLVSQLVRQLIQPKIVGDSMGMSPFVTLIFMFIGYRISSVFGMIIAVPIGIILINLYEAGAFDRIIGNIRELIVDFNRYRKS